MKKYHYTYYSYEEYGRGYIGKRSCKCKPEKDVTYFGSFVDTTFKPTQKIIIETFDTAEKAIDAEIKIQKFFKVVENPHFANQAYQTSTKFMINSETARKSKTPEQRSEIARKANASRTPEQRSEIARKANASRTPEQRSEIVRKGRANMTPEQRSEIIRKGRANMTPEQRKESIKKASSTKFQCTVTGFISNAGALSTYQKARGIDTSKRIKIS